jgi:hypothetical protein
VQHEVVDSDDADSDDEYTLDLLAQVIRERNAPPLDELAKAALANASVREVASVAAAFGKAGRSESESEDSDFNKIQINTKLQAVHTSPAPRAILVTNITHTLALNHAYDIIYTSVIELEHWPPACELCVCVVRR